MNIQEIKKQLPIGGVSEIARLSGVNYATVQRFFDGAKTKVNIKLLETTTQFLKDHKEKEAKALQELKAVAES